MTKTKLTEGRVKALRPRKNVRDIRDSHLRGFGVRVYPSGRKCYFIHIQHEGRRAWNAVGDAAITCLADAREQARSMMVATRSGTRPQTDQTLFETVAEEVFQRYGRSNWKPRTFEVNQYYLKNQLLPWFQGRQIGDITAAEVQDWFASLHKTPVSADRAAPVLSIIMACAETYGYRTEDSNPCRGIKRYRRQGERAFPLRGRNQSNRCQSEEVSGHLSGVRGDHTTPPVDRLSENGGGDAPVGRLSERTYSSQ